MYKADRGNFSLKKTPTSLILLFFFAAFCSFNAQSVPARTEAVLNKSLDNQTKNQSAQAVLPYQIISDVDDTLKISHVDNRWDLLQRSLFKLEAFSGMNLLIRLWNSKANGSELSTWTGVSGTVSFFKFWLQRFFDREGFAPRFLYLRPRELETFDFKINTIRQLLQQNTYQVLFFGDNTEYDPLVYQQIKREFPKRVLSIYIRAIHKPKVVSNQKMDPAINFFYSSLDIAYGEVLAGRLRPEQARQIYEELITESKKSWQKIIPDFAYCPKEIPDFVAENQNTNIKSKLQMTEHFDLLAMAYEIWWQQIIEHCQKRNGTEK